MDIQRVSPIEVYEKVFTVFIFFSINELSFTQVFTVFFPSFIHCRLIKRQEGGGVKPVRCRWLVGRQGCACFGKIRYGGIGRLATNSDFQSQGIGTRILDLIKFWFTEGNKTGCRFIIVDAANNERTLEFYRRNGFQFLDIRPEAAEDRTRLMFFDLLTFRE